MSTRVKEVPHTSFFTQEEVLHARRALRSKGALGNRAREIVRSAEDQLASLEICPAAEWIEELRPFSGSWLRRVCPACGMRGVWWQWDPSRPKAVSCAGCRRSFPNRRFPESDCVSANGFDYKYHRSRDGSVYLFSGVARGNRFETAVRVFNGSLAMAYLLTGDER